MKLAFCPGREMFQFIDPVRVARCSSSLTSSVSRQSPTLYVARVATKPGVYVIKMSLLLLVVQFS